MSAINGQKTLKTLVMGLAFFLVIAVQAQDSPLDILKKIQENRTEEAIRNQERESRFRSEADKQTSLMRQAEAEVAAKESARRKLQIEFDNT